MSARVSYIVCRGADALSLVHCLRDDVANPQICALMLDEMSIRQQGIWNGRKFTGVVDNGFDAENNDETATQALVLLLIRPPRCTHNRRSQKKLRVLLKLIDSARDTCIAVTKVNSIVATMKALNRENYLDNPAAIRIVLEKLTPSLLYRWYDYIETQQENSAELPDMAEFLNREAERCG
ncbi:hypothetical protein EVAR_53713_1 [Eumeta japonica]|uniref:Transposable element P transposase-like RNase H domain-containing protein n=1 Tax=Eumeta variegata TaxID=151549 RepID=A0A4C1Z390_EUMVA|nr:hypothetical protein EVAR_53713_1 [Eumeta japonica]